MERDFVKVQVIDGGIGISKENQRRLFSRFFRVDTSTTGTGLGLSIVETIIKKMGGKIRVKSRLGAGSTFTVLEYLYKRQALTACECCGNPKSYVRRGHIKP